MEVMSSQIAILLVDDHQLFRESLSRLLETEADFRIAGSHATATAALAAPELKETGIVLLDYDLGEEEGTRFLERAHDCGFRGQILLVTAGMSDAIMVRALENGASGIFLKHSHPSHLVEAIRKVSAGEVWLDPGVARTIIAAATGKHSTKGEVGGLTEREYAVLKGVLEGLTNKEIGTRLSISESSVKGVLQQLFEKTGVRTRSQLVRIAFEQHAEDWLRDPS
jgi:two-component system, NarL family, nitrate/nitrite response regulator NarL